jgi:hypothetical protein
MTCNDLLIVLFQNGINHNSNPGVVAIGLIYIQHIR